MLDFSDYENGRLVTESDKYWIVYFHVDSFNDMDEYQIISFGGRHL